jgi:hypothetical protein
MAVTTTKEFEREFGALISQIKQQATPFPKSVTQSEARKKRSAVDPFFFATTYFPHYIETKESYRDCWKDPDGKYDWIDAGFSPIHAEFFRIAEIKKQFSLLAAFRESAKDTLLGKIDVIRKLLTDDKDAMRWFVTVIAMSMGKAEGKIIPIKLELESNARLKQDYGELKGGTKWEMDHFMLSNGRAVKSYGREQGLRGEENFGHRPDHVIPNDVNDPTKPDSPAIVQKFVDSMKQDILKAVNSTRWSGVYLCNYTVKGDIVDALMTWKYTEHYNKKIFRALVPNEMDTKADRELAKLCRQAGFNETMKSAWEARHPTLSLLQDQKNDPETFDCEMMMRPRSRKDQKFRDEYFKFHTREQLAQRTYVNYTFVDPSAKEAADYKAVITVGLGVREDGSLHIPIRRASIQQGGIDAMVQETFRQKKAFNSKVVGVETNGFQILLKPEYLRQQKRFETALPFQELDHKGESKESRVERLVPYVKEGTITFDVEDPDQELLMRQLKAFPFGGTVAQGGLGDDGPDALQGCIEMIELYPHYGETEYKSLSKRSMRFAKEGGAF